MISNGKTAFGSMPGADFEKLQKALTDSQGTNLPNLVGGDALRIESRETVLHTLLAENQHFTLFNLLKKDPVGALINRWTVQRGDGGFMGSTFLNQTGNVGSFTGDYKHFTGAVKFMATRRDISLPTLLQDSIVPPDLAEERAGTVQMLSDASTMAYKGNSAVVPEWIDGIDTQLNTLGDAEHIIDMGGATFADATFLSQAAEVMSRRGKFGTPTHVLVPQQLQNDINNSTDAAFARFMFTNQPTELTRGSHVSAVQLLGMKADVLTDRYIDSERDQTPFIVRYPAVAAANNYTPVSIAAGVPGADAASKFGASHAGTYFWAVEGWTKAGGSGIVKTASTAVAAGQSVALTITASAANAETGYALYRSRKGGTNADNDFRFVAFIPKAGATTVYTDRNLEMPGTVSAYVLDMREGEGAICWKQFAPLTRLDLQVGVTGALVKSFYLYMWGYLQATYPQRMVRLKNIVTAGQLWKPFV